MGLPVYECKACKYTGVRPGRMKLAGKEVPCCNHCGSSDVVFLSQQVLEERAEAIKGKTMQLSFL